MAKFYSVRKAVEGIGCGMYGGYPSLLDCAEYRTDSKHPLPDEDSALRWGETVWTVGVNTQQCRFGFSSTPQLKAWLYNDVWREYLHERGYVVMVWELNHDNMHAGSAQAIAAEDALKRAPFKVLLLTDLDGEEMEL